MATNRSRNRSRGTTRWSGASSTFLAQGAGATGLTVISSGAVKATLLRIRGEIIGFMDGASAPGKLAEIAVGMILVPEGSSTTVTVSPIADSDAPWFFYRRFVIGYEEMVTDVVDVPGITSYRAVIDDKAMRIIRSGFEAQIVVENVTLGGSISANVVVTSRFLFLDG